ncbi:uncharacterized protein EAF01_006950 [Botrytis porri]|uniref:uncharacterized protein n=1 Tax=Botrytis porri TaxID=87229 RepID=UPI0019027858|nr:uncharacterized protein EAF01_006950 [Botrytis porri]KAF7901651.1 hypothetical protein EAF01_006950 [Botrytis porri]
MFSSLSLLSFVLWISCCFGFDLRGEYFGQSHSNSKCYTTCHFLSRILTGRVSFPGSTIYESEQLYWSLQQAELQPECRVTPMSAEDVSTTMQVLKSQGCQFAVKSGGHACFSGASNIENAVVIDLSNLDEINISSDRTEVSVGAGTLWSNLYPVMDAAEIGVIGGRVVGIGVGGLTLGGGISFHSGRYGFACDNVNNYQVVLANGSIRNVNRASYPDLYWALRGGGNNFGIVTRFDLASFEQGNMWGGTTTSNATELPNAIEALVNLNINHASDLFAAIFLVYVYVPSIESPLVSFTLDYGKPVINPPIFKNFTEIPAISADLRIATLTSLINATEESQPSGLRESYWTLTILNDADLIMEISKIFDQELQNIRNATNLLPALVFQPISEPMISHFSKNGGNSLGITTKDGPLILINIAIQWTDIIDDTRIIAFAENCVARSTTLAKERNLWHRFLYQNYAALQQDVFLSYGKENHERLVEISKKYDPDGVFVRLQPGYFKVY